MTSSDGSAISSDQDHSRPTSFSVRTVNDHASSGTHGVGPAESTGKSPVRYCPGGSRWSSACLLPWKPRVNMPIRPSCLDRRVDRAAETPGSSMLGFGGSG